MLNVCNNMQHVFHRVLTAKQPTQLGCMQGIILGDVQKQESSHR